jgi:hypothetical protein
MGRRRWTSHYTRAMSLQRIYWRRSLWQLPASCRVRSPTKQWLYETCADLNGYREPSPKRPHSRTTKRRPRGANSGFLNFSPSQRIMTMSYRMDCTIRKSRRIHSRGCSRLLDSTPHTQYTRKASSKNSIRE